MLGYRFDNDRWCAGRRFAAYRALLGDAFDGRVLPGDAANASPPPFFRDVVGTPHSVTTAHLVDEEGHLTLTARDEIIALLTTRLQHSRLEHLRLVTDAPAYTTSAVRRRLQGVRTATHQTK